MSEEEQSGNLGYQCYQFRQRNLGSSPIQNEWIYQIEGGNSSRPCLELLYGLRLGKFRISGCDRLEGVHEIFCILYKSSDLETVVSCYWRKVGLSFIAGTDGGKFDQRIESDVEISTDM